MSAPHILIVEDEALIAEDIADLCRLNGYTVAGTAYRASEALHMIEEAMPTLVLLDINLEDELSGIDIAEYLQKHHTIPFIFLTSYADKNTLEKAKSTGPLSYIVKPFNKEQLYSTIEIAWEQVQQHNLRELDLQKVLRATGEPLSPREIEVLSCIFKGLDTKGTAQALFVSVNTVKFHIKNLYDKFQVHSRAELIYQLKEWMK